MPSATASTPPKSCSRHVAGDGSWWEHDGRGIPLARVCSHCMSERLRSFRPEILRHYGQGDVDEPIDAED